MKTSEKLLDIQTGTLFVQQNSTVETQACERWNVHHNSSENQSQKKLVKIITQRF